MWRQDQLRGQAAEVNQVRAVVSTLGAGLGCEMSAGNHGDLNMKVHN